MKTTYEAVDEVYARLQGSTLKAAINGNVYKYEERPINSVKEDVVINALAIDNAQLQYGVLNVNVIVPDKEVQITEGVKQFVGQFSRLRQLAGIAATLLTDFWSGNYHFDIQQQVNGFDEESKQHYVNFRIDYYSINV